MNILISGASTGIGRACAQALAERGRKVWAGVRSQKSFDELSGLKIKGLTPLFLDVTDSQSISNALKELRAFPLNALINNAGIAVGGPIEGLPMEDWRRQFDINFFGLVELTRECLPKLRETRGRVLNMSSIGGRVAGPFTGPYSASKFALEAFSDSLRREMHRLGVHVSIIEPGPIQTPIWEKAVSEGTKVQKQLNSDLAAVYGESMNKFSKIMAKTGETAAPVEVVVRAVEHALSASSPRTRYPVGRGIKAMAKISNVLPDRWMDQLLRRRS